MWLAVVDDHLPLHLAVGALELDGALAPALHTHPVGLQLRVEHVTPWALAVVPTGAVHGSGLATVSVGV